MKYLNLINNENSKSEFNAILPNNFKVEKNTKIALEQLNLTFAGSQIVIDGTNNKIRFTPFARAGLGQTDIGNRAMTATLTEGIYTGMDELSREIQNSMNAGVPIWSIAGGSQNYQGLQWKTGIDTISKKFGFRYAHADPTASYQDILTNNINKTKTWPSSTPAGTWAGKEGGTNTTFDGYITTRLALSRSNNLIKFSLKTTDDTAEMMVGITKKQFTNGTTYELADFDYCFFTKAGSDEIWIKYGDVEELFEDSVSGNNFTTTTDPTVFKINMGEGSITFIIGNAFTETYEMDGKAYADTPNFLCLSTKQNSTYYIGYTTTAQDISFVQDAFQTTDANNHVIEVIPSTVIHNSLGAYASVNRYFLFPDNLATLLEFHRNIVLVAPSGDNILEGAHEIKPFISLTGWGPDNIHVQVVNLDLESHSNYGTKNILSVVPNADREDYNLSYKVNEKLFINLNNKEAQNISNLRIVVTDDLGFIFNIVPNTLSLALVFMDDSDLTRYN